MLNLIYHLFWRKYLKIIIWLINHCWLRTINDILSACSVCGHNISFVGETRESPKGKITDKWFGKSYSWSAKMCGWDDTKIIRYCYQIFRKRSYILRSDRCWWCGWWYLIYTEECNSGAHRPYLFFRTWIARHHFILWLLVKWFHYRKQMKNGHYKAIIFQVNYGGIINWFGHLMIIDRSKGWNSFPFWTWTNDIIAIKQ